MVLMFVHMVFRVTLHNHSGLIITFIQCRRSGWSSLHRIVGYLNVYLSQASTHLSLALPLKLSLFLLPQLLVELSASAGLVAVGLCGQGSVNLAQTVLLAQLLVVLVLALLLALELVGNGSLILCSWVSVLKLKGRGEGNRGNYDDWKGV
jgi:hypothetical protein